MSRSFWVVSVGVADTLVTEVEWVLSERGVAHTRVELAELRTHPQPVRDADPPAAAIVLTGPPRSDVLEVLRLVGAPRIPTMLMVTGLTESQESALLDAGAQDVMGLPATRRKVAGRIGALLRCTARALPSDADLLVLAEGAVQVDLARREVLVLGTEIGLTRSEFDLLAALARHPGRVVTRRELLRALEGRSTGQGTLESHVSRLRRKITRAGGPALVAAVRGVGYRLTSAR